MKRKRNQTNTQMINDEFTAPGREGRVAMQKAAQRRLGLMRNPFECTAYELTDQLRSFSNHIELSNDTELAECSPSFSVQTLSAGVFMEN